MKAKLFNNIGFIEHTFDEYELQPIKDEIYRLQEQNKKYVWGTIENDFTLKNVIDYADKLLTPSHREFEYAFNHMSRINILTKGLPLVLDSLWVNFQRKNEYLPLHNHAGVYSFVIWIKIPYEIENEQKHESSRYSSTIGKTHNLSGNFQFVYTGSTGEVATHNIQVDKTCENKMLMFPASMYHTVYPFYTSDEDRISVSGNFKLLV
jgi:hypothetical protein